MYFFDNNQLLEMSLFSKNFVQISPSLNKKNSGLTLNKKTKLYGTTWIKSNPQKEENQEKPSNLPITLPGVMVTIVIIKL